MVIAPIIMSPVFMDLFHFSMVNMFVLYTGHRVFIGDVSRECPRFP